MRKFVEVADIMDDKWSKTGADSPINWLSADVKDDPNLACRGPKSEVNVAQIYNLDAVAYESVVVGLFSIITGKHCNPPQPFKRGGEQDAVYLGFSRDGFNFFRSPLRTEAFLPQSRTLHAWNFQNVQSVGGGFLTHRDELQFFVGARSGTCAGMPGCEHGLFNGNATAGTAFLRRDGFASIAPATASAPSVLVTEVVQFDAPAEHLFVNARLNVSGSLVVEVLKGGTVYKKSQTLSGPVDGTAIRIQWTEHKPHSPTQPRPQPHPRTNPNMGLGDLAATPIRFRFTLSAGRLFSFWMSVSEGGCSRGPVAAGSSDFSGSRDVGC